MRNYRRGRASVLIASLTLASVGGWMLALTPFAAAVASDACQPAADQLVAAMAAAIPSTSPIWDQVQTSMAQSGQGGAAIDGMLAALSRNNYRWDCATQQLLGPNGLPASTAGVSNAPDSASTTGANATGSANGPSTSVGVSQGAGSPIRSRTGGGASSAANANASTQLATNTAGGGAGASSTLPVIAALVLSTALVVFVAFRHYRRSAEPAITE